MAASKFSSAAKYCPRSRCLDRNGCHQDRLRNLVCPLLLPARAADTLEQIRAGILVPEQQTEGLQVLRNGRLFSHRVQIGFPDLPSLEVSLRTGVRVRDMENLKRKQVMSHRQFCTNG